KTWIPECDNYLDALLRLEGRGPWWSRGCAVCKDTNATWRCEDCFGNRLLCGVCVVEKHWDEPLHVLQEWDEGYFQPRTTRDLGLRYQIGHPFSEDCPFNYLGLHRLHGSSQQWDPHGGRRFLQLQWHALGSQSAAKCGLVSSDT
ncbi:hypothetical protein K438DRAFT_2046357, partial [Mycena galopus ATCC 62051]